MQASSSSNTAYLMTESVVDNQGFDSVGGRKSEENVADLVEVSSDEVSSEELSLEDKEDYDVEEEDSDDEEDSEEEDSDDEEEEEEDNERKNIFGDLWKLKKLATFFQHPEKPVEVDGFAAGRSYFSRPSAAENLTEEEDEALALVLADARALKQSASAFMHPERPLDVDATACARNYFSQPWATEQETFGQAELRARLVEESHLLKERAATYRHPEAPINMEPGLNMARNYFLRASAPEVEDKDQAQVLNDMKALKQLASDYLHPEKPLEIDSTACARSYFTRPSALEQEEDEYCDEREIILEEMKELKQAATDYMHPEKPVEIDTIGARSYFDRPSAPEQDDEEDRELILQEMQALKKLAVCYMHPEKPLEVDAMACGRNYFTRPSAPEQEDDEYCDDREIVLEEMKELKQLASDYMHPERPLEVDSLACARNYFTRPSAAEQEEDEYCDDREIILEEMKELKQLASDYMHPEKPLEVHATACARSYFTRPSAPEQEEDEYCDEREIILEEMKELKQAATDYMHPEKPFEMDSAGARSYFDRHSAPEQDMDEEERELILQEMQALKKLAVCYMHPEKPLEVDAMACARNYFTRPSAPEQEEDEYCDDREIVLEEMKELKQLASDFLHPEKPLEVHSMACARNYFTRPSAPEQEEDEYCDDREIILEEMKELKQLASDYMHPEKPVEVDGEACARNYFTRPSAPEQDDDEYEREMILKEMMHLKHLASDYLHPEKPVEMDPTSFGRNYFGRPSAPEYEGDEYASNHEMVHMDAAKLYHLAVDFLHPERPVSVDPMAFGRNYYSRASADEQEMLPEDRSLALEETAELKKLASDYMHPEKPLDVDPTSFGRNYYGRASAPESLDEQERAQVLAEASVLKKLAVDYLHPEVPVKTSDPAAVGRNYFSRASALGVAEHITSSGYENSADPKADDISHHDDYGHFEMDEEIFYDFRQSIVVPLAGDAANMAYPKIQSSKFTSEEEGELSRSPSSVMLFTGALETHDHPPLPHLG